MSWTGPAGFHNQTALGTLLTAALCLLGCGEGKDQLPTEPTATPATGSIEVTVATAGASIPSRFLVELDGVLVDEIGPNGKLLLSDLEAGEHSVALRESPPNCSVLGGHDRRITVATEATAGVSFEVECTTTLGNLEIVTSTTGQEPDLDGYRVSFGRQLVPAEEIGSNDTVTISDIESGDYEVLLEEVAQNCGVDGGNPQTVSIEASQTATARFTVVCWEVPTLRMAYVKYADSGSTIRVRDEDGSEAILGRGNYPAWSPDGSRIAFASSGIFIVDADGSNLYGPFGGSQAGWPSWSPDGQRLTFSDLSTYDLYVVGLDGSGLVNITSGTAAGGMALDPAWSPDGTRIALVLWTSWFTSELAIINADGSDSSDSRASPTSLSIQPGRPTVPESLSLSETTPASTSS